MSTSLISYVLGADYQQSRTAAQVRTLKPGQWAADDLVPICYYRPLSYILLGLQDNPAAQTALQKIIIGSYGLGETPDALSIQLISLPTESALKADGMRSDKTGAETALLKILVQIGEDLGPAEALKAEQADLRIRFLLDALCRVEMKKGGETLITASGLPPEGDPTVDINLPVRCQWLGFIDNETAIGKASLYRLEYTRVVV